MLSLQMVPAGRFVVRRWLPAVLALCFLLLLSSPASGQVYVGVPPPERGPSDVQVLGVSGQNSTDVQVLGVSGRNAGVTPRLPRASGTNMALTGADTIELCSLALIFLATGVVLSRLGRRRTSPADNL